MTVYIDASVLLRKLFNEPEPLAEWSRIKTAYTSRILLIELGRVIDRCRLNGDIDDADVEKLHVEAARVIKSINVVAISEAVLNRAASAMPTVVGSLDAIHLVTALQLKDAHQNIAVATHDDQLARACRASGLAVIGA